MYSDILLVLSAWKQLELRYSANLYDGIGKRGEICHLPGGEVIFTAAHALNHVRNGTQKLADRWTGGLAEAMANATGHQALTAIGAMDDDPNWDVTIGVFKEKLRSI